MVDNTLGSGNLRYAFDTDNIIHFLMDYVNKNELELSK